MGCCIFGALVITNAIVIYQRLRAFRWFALGLAVAGVGLLAFGLQGGHQTHFWM